MQRVDILNKIVQQFIEECQNRDLKVDRKFAYRLVNLLAHDSREGLELNLKKFSECKVENFLKNLVQKYSNPLDATICNLKLSHYFKSCRELNVEYVKEKYELHFKTKLRQLIEDILQYPETSNNEQIEKMFGKMQVFIIACYNIGCPKNHVLLKQTKQSLNSVLGRGDLQNYILKKKYHRLDYLKRLSATVCGILIYNNMSPHGEKENMRDIRVDLEMAQQNTKESLKASLMKIGEYKNYGVSSIENVIQINVEQKKVHCYWPIEKVREINKFLVLYNIYERYLNKLVETFEKTAYLIEVNLEKFKCVLNKINEVLKFRTAIESELIFPHFVYLSEVWQSLVLYLNHLTEINKIRDQMEAYVSDDLEVRFLEIVEEVKARSQQKKPWNPTFEELMERTNKKEGKSDLLKIKDFSNEYCALTIALTNGLLVPSKLQKKLSNNLDLQFGFRNTEFSKYAERHMDDFLKAFKNAVFTSIDLISLFNLEDEILIYGQMNDTIETKTKTSNYDTQTEMVIVGNVSVPNRINTTWNKWDFHRETIRLANIRKRQTHSSQTALTYGQRNAQNQAYNTKKHI